MTQETMQAALTVIGLLAVVYSALAIIEAIVKAWINRKENAEVYERIFQLNNLHGEEKALEFIRNLNYGWSDKAMISYFNKAVKEDPQMLGVIRALCLNYMREESESLRRELDAAFERDIESVLSRPGIFDYKPSVILKETKPND